MKGKLLTVKEISELKDTNKKYFMESIEEYCGWGNGIFELRGSNFFQDDILTCCVGSIGIKDGRVSVYEWIEEPIDPKYIKGYRFLTNFSRPYLWACEEAIKETPGKFLICGKATDYKGNSLGDGCFSFYAKGEKPEDLSWFWRKFDGIKIQDKTKEPKTYETWEVFKAVTENPKLEFKRTCDGLIFGGCLIDTSFKWESGRKHLSRSDKWTLVQQPVPFLEAAVAYCSDIEIFSQDNNGNSHYYNPTKDLTYTMTDENGAAISAEEILCWKWFIGKKYGR